MDSKPFPTVTFYLHKGHDKLVYHNCHEITEGDTFIRLDLGDPGFVWVKKNIVQLVETIKGEYL
jgi:hypothetical protein